jgi:hypothetical protein
MKQSAFVYGLPVTQRAARPSQSYGGKAPPAGTIKRNVLGRERRNYKRAILRRSLEVR